MPQSSRVHTLQRRQSQRNLPTRNTHQGQTGKYVNMLCVVGFVRVCVLAGEFSNSLLMSQGISSYTLHRQVGRSRRRRLLAAMRDLLWTLMARLKNRCWTKLTWMQCDSLLLHLFPELRHYALSHYTSVDLCPLTPTHDAAWVHTLCMHSLHELKQCFTLNSLKTPQVE